MNIRDSKKLKFLQEWRNDHLCQMHWALLTLRDYLGSKEAKEETSNSLQRYIKWCGQRAYELKGIIDKLERQ